MYENVFPASACWLNKSVPFGRVEPLHSALGHTLTPMLTGETIRPMRGDANRRRTDFRPANLPLADGPSPEGPAAGDMHRILPRVAGCTVLRIIVRSDALGDAWGRLGRLGPAGDHCQIDGDQNPRPSRG